MDSLRALRRKKVEKEDLPKDTLAIYDLQKRQLDTIGGVASFKMAEKWPGSIAYLLEPAEIDSALADSLNLKEENEGKR